MSDTRRDRWGRYLVVPPGVDKPVGYTRATTIAKVLDSEGGLVPWKTTHAMLGAYRDRGLDAEWQALIAQHPDPWYSSPESKAKAKALVERCATAGGADRAAQVGTALHALTDRIDRGEQPLDIRDDTRRDLDAYRTAIAAAGIVVDRTLIERVVVLDEHRVAGTADRLAVDMPGVGRVVADLKTGADLSYSWQSIAVQLAIYANADAMYSQGDAADGSLDVREPMPSGLSREVGLVIHLPAGQARVHLYTVDLVAGWEAFELSQRVKAWRSRRDIAREHEVGSGFSVAGFLRPGSAPVDGPAPSTGAPKSSTSSGDAPLLVLASPQPHDVDDFTGLPLAQNSGAAALAVAPTSSAVLDDFDTGVASSSWLQEAQAARARVVQTHTHPSNRVTMPDEGDAVSADGPNAVRAAYQALDDVSRTWIGRLCTDAQRAGVSFHLSERHTLRRFELLRALVALARIPQRDDAVLRALLEESTTLDVSASFTNTPTGVLLGSLDAAQATAFADLCSQYASEPETTTTEANP